MTGINVKVDLFYSMLFYLMDAFAQKRLVRDKAGDDMCGVRNWLDDRIELAIRERDDSYDVWSNNVNRVRGDRLWVDYISKRRHADALVEKKYSQFVSINLDPGLSPRKLYDNLRRLGVINEPERIGGDVDVERLSSFFFDETVIELTVFQSGFRRHHSTKAAVLKVTEDIRSNMEDGQVTVLVLLGFSEAFDMVKHGLLLCKLRSLQSYSDGARLLVDSFLNGRTLL
jgi:hypothetical protein